MSATYQVRASVEVEDLAQLYEAARDACVVRGSMDEAAITDMIGPQDEPNVEACISATVLVWSSPDGTQVDDEEVEHLFGVSEGAE